MAYSVQMNADDARRKVQQGGTLLLLDAPEQLIFGIDQTAFLAGAKFQGVKMVPCGAHIITTTLLAPDRSVPTVARWVFVKPGAIEVARWEAELGRFCTLQDDEEAGRYRLGVQRYDFDAGLAPYPLHSHGQWLALSCHISEGSLARLAPPSGFLDPLAEARDLNLAKPATAAERRLLQQLATGREAFPESDGAAPASTEAGAPQAAAASVPQRERRDGRCCYTAISANVKSGGVGAAGLTAANLDKSAVLERLFLGSAGGAAALLGELQFAFVNFVAGKSLEGLLQWKALLALLFSCDTAATETHCSVFVAMLQCLTAQLAFAIPTEDGSDASGEQGGVEVASGLEAAELLRDSFLQRGARDFLGVLAQEQQRLPQALWHQVQLFQRVLSERLPLVGFDEAGDYDDEDGPVVVALPDDAPE